METLEKLREACEPQQQLFAQCLILGMTQGKAYDKSGYTANNDNNKRSNASELAAKPNVRAYFNALKVEREAKVLRVERITRESQLSMLLDAHDIAKEKRKASSMAVCLREMNAMLGYHTELAPNAAKEALRRLISDEERRLLEAFARERTGRKAIECEVHDVQG